MSATTVTAFIATCVLLAVTPGPNMALIISATLSGGLGGGLATLLGCMTGLAVLVTIAAVGMTSVMLLMADWFDVVRWIGALYLVFLGSRQLWTWWQTRATPATLSSGPLQPRLASSQGRFLQGLAISLSNPKVLLFLGAFFPQFVDPLSAPGPQLAVLAGIFVVVLTAVDVSYTVAIARARRDRTLPPANTRCGLRPAPRRGRADPRHGTKALSRNPAAAKPPTSSIAASSSVPELMMRRRCGRHHGRASLRP